MGTESWLYHRPVLYSLPCCNGQYSSSSSDLRLQISLQICRHDRRERAAAECGSHPAQTNPAQVATMVLSVQVLREGLYLLMNLDTARPVARTLDQSRRTGQVADLRHGPLCPVWRSTRKHTPYWSWLNPDSSQRSKADLHVVSSCVLQLPLRPSHPSGPQIAPHAAWAREHPSSTMGRKRAFLGRTHATRPAAGAKKAGRRHDRRPQSGRHMPPPKAMPRP